MATVFGKEERDFYNAFFIPNADKRRDALNKWIKSATPAIQAAVEEELETFIEFITANRWSVDGWIAGEEKLRGMQNDYHLIMDINLRKIGSKDILKGKISDPVIIGSRDIMKGRMPAPIVRKTEIDLHGKTVSEAISLVNEFLKDSYNAHERQVLIIHGKGTGTLREEVRRYLGKHPYVESFTTADKSQGDEGATQVNIKEWNVS